MLYEGLPYFIKEGDRCMDVDTFLPIGQQLARTRWGTQEKGAAFDRKKSFYLTEQAQNFIAQQAFCVIAGKGPRHELDAQLIMERPGFVEFIDQQTCLLYFHDRLRTSLLFQGLQQSSSAELSDQVGLFFICHTTRERLCVQAKAQLLSGKKSPPFLPSIQERSLCIRLTVQQSFFHCAKYIRTRVSGLTAPLTPSSRQKWHPQRLLNGNLDSLSEELHAFLAQQVFCFLCTISQNGQCAVNHRGGAPGFLLTLPPDTASLHGTVLLPDYTGNGAFEALGNILETGLATVLVPHYAAQLAVCIAGTARICELAELPTGLAQKFPGAERMIALSVQRIAVQHGDWSTTLACERFRAESIGTTIDPALAYPV
ncbi:MAG TPA: hypothetical protein DHW02_20490 [Ktedonobacter sp.]|nr:hypothetical protein [Ktedonobacter sp.]